MKNSKLAELLHSFSKKEIKEFRKFVDSPFFNNDSTIRSALNEILQFYPEMSADGFTKENLFEKLYTGKEYNDSRIRNIVSDLLGLGRNFVSIQKFMETEYACEKKILLDHDKRKLDTQFNLIQKEQRSKLISEKNRETRYAELLELEKITGEFNYRRNNQPEIIKSSPLQGEYLIVTFLYKFIKLNIQIFKDVHNYNIKHEKLLLEIFNENLDLEKLLKDIKKNFPAYYPLIAIYNQIYRSQQNTLEVKYYTETLKLFDIYIDELSEREKFYILHNLATICIDKIHAGIPDFKYKLFDIYQRMNELNMLYDSPESRNMSVLLFRNVMIISLRVNEIEWAEDFVRNNIKKLQKESAENMLNYAMAMIEQARKNYNKAIEYASKVKMELSNFKYDLKIIILTGYYELNETEPAIYQLSSFKVFLKQNREMSDKSKETFIFYANSYEKLLKLKLGFDDYLFDQLNKEMSISTSPYRDWFTEKLSEFRKVSKTKRA